MIPPDESFIADMVKRATIETRGGDIRFITVPGIEMIPESQQMAIFKKAEERLTSSRLDADDLYSRLECITPPPDREEDEEECRVLDAQARKDLESEGCPPCYPAWLQVPIRDPPEECREIVEYWQSFSSTDDVVLCAQRADWREFKKCRKGLRHRYSSQAFDSYVDKVRERRRTYGLDSDVHLLLDIQKQSRLQNWIEFQDYHLTIHDMKTKQRDGLERELDNPPKAASTTDLERRQNAFRRRLVYAESNLRRHEVMLWWIEQCRLAMVPPPTTPIERGTGDQRSPSNRQRRSKRRDPLAVHGKGRVSKSTPLRRNTRTQTNKTTATDSAIMIPSSTEQQMSTRREVRPRRAKEKALAQLFPQRVTKANRSADTRTKPRPGIQCSDEVHIRDRVKPQRRSDTQQPCSTPKIIMTRSKRISRQPVRWAPE